MITHSEIGRLEFNAITPYIYIGTNACCQAHFAKELLEKGIEADLSLEEEKLDSPFGVTFFLWLPVKNYQAPTQEQLRIGISFISELLKLKKKVYAHCQNGHGRAPTLVAAYSISQGMGVEKAIEFIKSKRPVIHINEEQQQALKEFENGQTQLTRQSGK